MKRGIPNNTRWKIYADYLAAHGDNYAQIFTTDTRDVIFQGDVFALFKGRSNWLGYVTEATHIGGQFPINYNWLVDIFGRAEADKIADKRIICDGTVIGSSAALKIFATKMWDILSRTESRVDYRIHDQPVMNYLVHNNRLPIKNLIEIDVQRGEIFTAAQFHRIYPVKIRGDKILRGDGGVPAVVHQYDRSENLVELVDKVYRDKNFSFAARFADTRSTVEQVACLLHADKTAEVTQIFLRKFLSPADFGKSINALINILEVTARKNFTKPVEILELAVQNALMSVEKLSVKQVFTVHRFIYRAKKNHHAVDPQLKEKIADCLFEFTEEYFDAGALEGCLLFMEMIEALDVPLNKNFYLLQSKINRLLRAQ